ncbi:MAG: hydrogenase nickel incorporation protein HypB, partial [Candidatus Omnitrophica bacterium]|nr:hydrogenase nickel incorporation protein HypB [Candidatus Omnitrophota bacterium]
ALQAIQINTGMSCHLYANQISESLKKLKLDEADYVFIENVGNLVCPGEFDLGENLKVVLLSVPEGDDKVAKYPTIFRVADVVLLTKSDLLGILDFDIQRVKDDIAKLNANVTFIEISSKTSSGMEEWIAWLKEKRGKSVGQQARFVTEE